MVLDIYHNTTYTYTAPVFPEPHHLYLYPSERFYVKKLGTSIQVNPVPAGQVIRTNVENNIYYQVWFNQQVTSLTIAAHMKVEVQPFNPFEFFIEAERPVTPGLKPFLILEEQPCHEMESWLENYALRGSDLLASLVELNAKMGVDWGHDIRYGEGLLSINKTFTSRKGSCRDLSWMMIQMLRSKSIPARFISGYAFNPELGEDHELHAWVEAYLPGAGWVGFDPTAGMLTDHHYIPMASSYDPRLTLPVQGTFRGAAKSQLSFDVKIEAG